MLRAFKDLFDHAFLNLLAVVTISFSVLVFSAFMLVIVNADQFIRHWMRETRIMAYLKPGLTPETLTGLGRELQAIDGVIRADFISKDEALRRFREKLGPQASLADNLATNPLPDAFELHLVPLPDLWERIPDIAGRVASRSGVADVEYGRRWLGHLTALLKLFRVSGYALGGLFFLATAFFVANTTRLLLHSRREEIAIMRLVGASESFIRDPFYVQSFVLGLSGGLAGLGGLAAAFRYLVEKTGPTLAGSTTPLRFLPMELMLSVIAGAMMVGWLGCFISLKQFLRRV